MWSSPRGPEEILPRTGHLVVFGGVVHRERQVKWSRKAQRPCTTKETMKTLLFWLLLGAGSSFLTLASPTPQKESQVHLSPHASALKMPFPSSPPKHLLVSTLTGLEGLGIDLYHQQRRAVFHLKTRVDGQETEQVFRVQFTCGKPPEVDVLTVTGQQDGEAITSNPPSYHQDAQLVLALLISMQVRWDSNSVTVAARRGAPLFTVQEGREGPVDLHIHAAHAYCEGGALKLDSSGLQDLSDYSFLANPVLDLSGNTYARKFQDRGEHVLLHTPVFTVPSKRGEPTVVDTVVLYLKKDPTSEAYRVIPFTRLRGDPTTGKQQHFLLHQGVLHPVRPFAEPGPALSKVQIPLGGKVHIYSSARPERLSGWLKTVFDLDTQVVYTVPAKKPPGRFSPDTFLKR